MAACLPGLFWSVAGWLAWLAGLLNDELLVAWLAGLLLVLVGFWLVAVWLVGCLTGFLVGSSWLVGWLSECQFSWFASSTCIGVKELGAL